mgnify:CR=1 FL=1
MTICSCYKTLHKIKIHNNYLLDLMTVPKNIYFIILLIYLINQFSYTFALHNEISMHNPGLMPLS